MKTMIRIHQTALALSALVANLSSITPAKAGSFISTGMMVTNRYAHTATLLTNGQVLVAGGGCNSNGTIAIFSSELYDPAAGTWKMTGEMVNARKEHKATLLPDGKVLVTGGYDIHSHAQASAEVYDPAGGAWTETAPMTSARSIHGATLLPNGKVLVTGGFTGSGFIDGVEEYDPGAGTWTAATAMGAVRYGHTATLLPNGKVLVAGGGSGGYYHLSSAEIYDPATGKWTPTGAMSTPRAGHTATLLPSGKVLVAGGVAGHGDTYLSSAEIYDPATENWKPNGSMSSRRDGHTATLLPNSKVLVVGGYKGPYSGDGYLSNADACDPATGIWTPTSPLSIGHDMHTATLLPDGKVLVAGGNGTNGVLSIAQLYDLLTVSIALYAGFPGLTIDGVVGQTYGVQSTLDLSNTNSWVGRTNITLTTPTYLWYDSQPATQPQTYYRVLPGPISIP